MSASGIQLIFCQSLGKCLYVLMHRKGHSTYRYNQYYRPNMMPAFRKYLFYKMPKMSMTTLLSTSDYDGGPAHFGTLKLAAENLVKTTFCQSKIGKYLSIGHFFTKILFSNEKMRFGSYIDDQILK